MPMPPRTTTTTIQRLSDKIASLAPNPRGNNLVFHDLVFDLPFLAFETRRIFGLSVYHGTKLRDTYLH
jgi:hypothetical protein